MTQGNADLLAYPGYILQIDVAVGATGRANANEGNVAARDSCRRVGGGRQAFGLDLLLNDAVDVLFDDRRLAGVNELDFPGIRIDADHLMALLRQTSC